jgi:hypothetical protein
MRTSRTRLFPLLALVALTLGCTAHRQAGTGDVAFRLVWDGRSDLDLVVEDPGSGCIFYGQRHSELGGLLDVDCNAGTGRLCEHPIENVFWPVGTAPPGRYRFWVHAHALFPAEAPLSFEIQLLAGPDVAWRHADRVMEHEELFGPFVYQLPGGDVTLEPASDEPPTGCAGLFTRRFLFMPPVDPDG